MLCIYWQTTCSTTTICLAVLEKRYLGLNLNLNLHLNLNTSLAFLKKKRNHGLLYDIHVVIVVEVEVEVEVVAVLWPSIQYRHARFLASGFTQLFAAIMSLIWCSNTTLHDWLIAQQTNIWGDGKVYTGKEIERKGNPSHNRLSSRFICLSFVRRFPVRLTVSSVLWLFVRSFGL